MKIVHFSAQNLIVIGLMGEKSQRKIKLFKDFADSG